MSRPRRRATSTSWRNSRSSPAPNRRRSPRSSPPWQTPRRASERSAARRSGPVASRRTATERKKSSRERHRTSANATATVPSPTPGVVPDPFVETELEIVVGTRAAITAAQGLTVFDGHDGDGELDDETLTHVFTDVLAPKVAGEDGGDIEALRTRIGETI
ncbi:hypothetical protein A6E15_06785 [Natrinema saccharevitans]|uniref:Uncharacterized protein n=1 Tax=Natrinema saccharevitans TaxID=301967 RepID=A0A1S8AV54_9EURY|nr:hypothetical protein A6E15_06785 [Natrinema saccharevitans]